MPTNPTKQIDPVVEARGLLSQITPFPWRYIHPYMIGLDNSKPQGFADLIVELPARVRQAETLTTEEALQVERDYRFIARAPELLKTLADEVERLRKVVDVPPNERLVCDCHTWPTVSEMHDYVVALEQKVQGLLAEDGSNPNSDAVKALREKYDAEEKDHRLTIDTFRQQERIWNQKFDEQESANTVLREQLAHVTTSLDELRGCRDQWLTMLNPPTGYESVDDAIRLLQSQLAQVTQERDDLLNRSHQTVLFDCGCMFKQEGLDAEPMLIVHCPTKENHEQPQQ